MALHLHHHASAVNGGRGLGVSDGARNRNVGKLILRVPSGIVEREGERSTPRSGGPALAHIRAVYGASYLGGRIMHGGTCSGTETHCHRVTKLRDDDGSGDSKSISSPPFRHAVAAVACCSVDDRQTDARRSRVACPLRPTPPPLASAAVQPRCDAMPQRRSPCHARPCHAQPGQGLSCIVALAAKPSSHPTGHPPAKPPCPPTTTHPPCSPTPRSPRPPRSTILFHGLHQTTPRLAASQPALDPDLPKRLNTRRAAVSARHGVSCPLSGSAPQFVALALLMACVQAPLL